MTVEQLIEKLKEFDKNLTVVYNETGASRHICQVYLIYDDKEKMVYLD